MTEFINDTYNFEVHGETRVNLVEWLILASMSGLVRVAFFRAAAKGVILTARAAAEAELRCCLPELNISNNIFLKQGKTWKGKQNKLMTKIKLLLTKQYPDKKIEQKIQGEVEKLPWVEEKPRWVKTLLNEF